ncbi:hypothetical protein G9A89_015516 [Geosiphon pyriformis]|nr:hypothetical protein G9A89_015516 [Geosiphon pyriformis]
MNNSAKQEDIIHWHKNMGNVISVIMNKFDGIQVFTSGLESGYLGAGVTIIMNASLAKHVCKVSEVFGRLISVKLIFKNKLSVTVLGLYTDIILKKRLVHSHVVNLMVAEALNSSTFVICGGDFNKNDSGCNTSYMVQFERCSEVHRFYIVDIGLGGLLNSQLNLIYKQATKEKWRYKVSDISVEVWKKFGDVLLAAASEAAGDFEYHKSKSDINGMWTQLCWMVCSAVEATLIKTWYRDSGLVKTAASSRFHKLELLMAKILKAYKSENLEEF